MKRLKSKYTISIVLAAFLITAFLSLYFVPDIFAETDESARVAFIDLWAVFNVHPQKSVAEAELNELAQTMQAELEERVREENLTAEQQQELLKEYQARLSQREQELIEEIIDSIREVVVLVAEEREIEIVLDKQNVIYGGYNLSEDIILYINEEYGQEAEMETEINTEEDENIIELEDTIDIDN